LDYWMTSSRRASRSAQTEQISVLLSRLLTFGAPVNSALQ
jgi:hypothetical protein